MASNLIELIKAFIEKIIFFPAGAFTALTIVALRNYGMLLNLKDEASWIYIFGIFCGWCACLLGLQNFWKRVCSWVTKHRENSRKKNAEIAKLKILTNEQIEYLVFIKAHRLKQFQADEMNNVIIGLSSMGLLIQRESTGRHKCRCEVPKHIWGIISRLDWEPNHPVPNHAPWEEARNGRIRL